MAQGSEYDFRTKPHAGRLTQHQPGKTEPVESEHFKPIGTPKAGYAPPAQGPFLCGNCVHYLPIEEDEGTCDHPDVIADMKAGAAGLEKGREDGNAAAVVHKGGCCAYYRPGKHEGGVTGEESESAA